MQSKIIVTEDKSKTLLIPELNETYHSTKGAITEAQHIFIKEGLHYSGQKELKIFEMGFGTGLNALITLKESIEHSLCIDYYSIELHPLSYNLIKEMDYIKSLQVESLESFFENMHISKSQETIHLGNNFKFTKLIGSIENETLPQNYFDLIYYDAFSPKINPELWSLDVLKKIRSSMNDNGILTTYCAQGQFKRNLTALEMKVESIPGPPGKREMTRAFK